MNKRQRKKWLKQHNLYINPRDTWNLDITIAEFILPRLKQFAKETITYPARLNSMEEWQSILSQMIKAFEVILADDVICFVSDEQRQTINTGLDLFREYYFDLWW